MQRKAIMSILTALTLGLLLVLPTVVHGQSGGAYDLTWNTIDNGGGQSTGGSYALNGTIGQADASVLSGGGYILSGGYWGYLSTSALNYLVYLPVVLR